MLLKLLLSFFHSIVSIASPSPYVLRYNSLTIELMAAKNTVKDAIELQFTKNFYVSPF